MTKVFSAIVLIAVAAHLIRPFGLPGLRKRSDAWKIALVALALITLTAVIRPEG